MENMTFYDIITFVIDFVMVRFLLQTSFHSFLKHRKNMTFMTVNSPSDKMKYVVLQGLTFFCNKGPILLEIKLSCVRAARSNNNWEKLFKL